MSSSRFLLSPSGLMARAAILALGFAISATPLAHAQTASGTTKVRKQTITIKESEGNADDDKPASAGPVTEEVEKVKTATFGSRSQTGMAGCKTDDAIKDTIKDLKADCGAWVKDQKSELKSRFLTSSCEEICEDCGMSLRRCHVLGTISYVLKITRPQ